VCFNADQHFRLASTELPDTAKMTSAELQGEDIGAKVVSVAKRHQAELVIGQPQK